MAGDRVTRVATDLLEAAAVEGARHSRSAKQQLDHWARVGRTVSSFHSAACRRVEAALQGSMPMKELSADELLVANARIDASIVEQRRVVDVGAVLAGEGSATVALDEDGRLVRYEPDGTTTLLD